MTNTKVDFGLILKLTLWSFAVGLFLYWMEWSPGEVYGWIANKAAAFWDWLVGTGLTYVLLGATIVVPAYILLRLKGRMSK